MIPFNRQGDNMKIDNNWSIMEQVKQYINDTEYGKPILLNEVTHDFNNVEDELKKTKNTISKTLNRLVDINELQKLDNGIFYKEKETKFGKLSIDYSELIKSIYIFDAVDKKTIGYRIGTSVLANIGITNNMENITEIVTNNYNKKNILNKINLNVHLKRPVIEITNDNYLYLQLLDTIKDIKKYHLTNNQIGSKLVSYMYKKEIEIDKLFNITKQYYSKQTMKNLVELLGL